MAQQGRENVGGGEVGALTRPNEYLTYGMKGFFITTNSSWSDCVKDAYQLLQKHHEGEEPGATSDSSTPTPLFRAVATGVSKVVFIATGVESPTELAYQIFDDVISKQGSESQHVNRFLPVELTVFCYNLEEVKPKLQKLLEKRLPKGSMTFKVVFNSNNCNLLKIRPDDFLQMVTCMVSKINPLGDLDLNDADYTIVGEAVKQILCLGIVKNFKNYAKYNLAEAATSPSATPIPAHFWELVPEAEERNVQDGQEASSHMEFEGLTAASSVETASPPSTTNVNGSNQSDADGATSVDTSLSPLAKLDVGSQTSIETPPEPKDESYVVKTLASPTPSAPDITDMQGDIGDRNDGPVETQSSNIVTMEEVTGSSDSESSGVPLASGEDAEADAGVTVLEGEKVGKVPTTTGVVDASTRANISENGGGLNSRRDPAQTSLPLTTPKEGLPVTDPSKLPGTPSGASTNSTPAEVGTERNAEDGKEASPNMVTPESRVFPVNFVLQTNDMENLDVGSQTSNEQPPEPKDESHVVTTLASPAPSAPHISEKHENIGDMNGGNEETAVEDQQVTTTPTLAPEDRNQSTASSSSSPPPPATAVNGSNQLDANGDAEPANINTPNSSLDESGGAVVPSSQFSMTEDIVDVVNSMERQMEEFSANFQAFNMELATVLHGKIEEFAARLHGMVDGKKDGEGFH